MNSDTLVHVMFWIFTGAALMSTLALYTRQSLLVAYIILGAILGPYGARLVPDITLVHHIGEVGIIFLLFLLGLHLQPQNLLHMLRKMTLVGIVSSVLLLAMGYTIAILFGFTQTESVIIGTAVMFSSTIIGLKLLPTTILHHQHTGEVMISVLLMQDLLAIVVLLVINSIHTHAVDFKHISLVILGLPALIFAAFILERYVLLRLLAKFDRTQEYVFLLAIGWCLGFAEFAHYFGLSLEIGAFIAGVALASSPISLFIAEALKPLRDFFLVIFFFSIGAGFNFAYLPQVILPSLILGLLLLVLKPFIFQKLLQFAGESKNVATEVGIRLGQASEFSLLVSALAFSAELITPRANYFIQATTLITFLVSSYLVVLWYPTPIALTERLRRD